MSHADFLGICRAVYRELQGALSILQALTEIILAISEDSLPNSPTTPTEQPASESSTLSEDLQDLVYAAADAANGRFSRVMSARADIHTSLSLDEFIVLFKESWAFALTCEIMCKRMIVGLRGTLVSQSKAFLSSFHRKSVETSARLIENEHWAPAEVPSQIQHTVNLMVEGAVADPKALIVDTDSADTSREAEKVATSGLTKTLDIEGRDYHAVSACLRCLETLQDYLKIVINITLLTTETMGRIVEFLKVSTCI